MTLENKLGLSNPVNFACAEERISKKKALILFDSGTLNKLEAGTVSSLKEIHKYLFDEIYDFATEKNFPYEGLSVEASVKHLATIKQIMKSLQDKNYIRREKGKRYGKWKVLV